MNEINHEPKLNSRKFKCSHCGILAQQNWSNGSTIANSFTRQMGRYFLDYRTEVDVYGQEYIKKFCRSYASNLKKVNNPIHLKISIFQFVRIVNAQLCGLVKIWLFQGNFQFMNPWMRK